MAKNQLQVLADELEQVMDEREAKEAEIEPLKEREDEIREKLVKGLLSKGFQYIKTTSGMGFGIVQGRKTFMIKAGQERAAIEWAQQTYPGLLTLNKSDLAKVLKPMLEVPAFFEEKTGDPHLSVRTENQL